MIKDMRVDRIRVLVEVIEIDYDNSTGTEEKLGRVISKEYVKEFGIEKYEITQQEQLALITQARFTVDAALLEFWQQTGRNNP